MSETAENDADVSLGVNSTTQIITVHLRAGLSLNTIAATTTFPKAGINTTWPISATTGVISDGVRTPYTSYAQLTPSAGFSTTANGQVIEGLDITSGRIEVLHNDVTIRYCRIQHTGYDGIRNCEDHDPAGNTGLLVHDVEIDSINAPADGGTNLPSAMLTIGYNTPFPIFRRMWIHNNVMGAKFYNGFTLEDSLLLTNIGVPDTQIDPHREAAVVRGGPGGTLTGSVFRSIDPSRDGHSAASAIYNNPSGMNNLLMDSCLIDASQLDYGTYTSYLGDTHPASPDPYNITITNNWFSKRNGNPNYYSGKVTEPGSTFSGNKKWEPDGLAPHGEALT